MKKIYLLIIILSPLLSIAQNYTIAPSNTLTVSAPLNKTTVFDIFMDNTSNHKISLSHQLISKDIPVDWDYSLCDFGHCYTGIPTDGTMDSVIAPDRGFLGVNVVPTGTGTATVVMYVYETAFPTLGDTLTWIINAGVTGIHENMLTNNGLSLYPNPASDKLNIDSKQDINRISIYDLTGRLVYQSASIGNDQHMIIDIQELPQASYFLKVDYADGSIGTQKIMKK